MGFDRVLHHVAGGVQRRPKTIIAVVLLLTIGSGYFLQNLTYETDMTTFFPDNEIVEANERVEEYFGKDAYVHLVEVEGVRGKNVLSPQALREQFNITLAAEDSEGVVGSQSVAVVINELCHYVIDADGLGFSYTYDENTTILNTRLDWVQGRINLLKSIMNGEIDPGQFGQGDVVIEPDAVKFSFGLLMSSDFDLENFTASRTLILIEMDGNYSRSELRDIVGQVKDSIAALDLHYITEQETSEYYIAHEMESTIQPTMVMLGIGIVAIITVILVGSFRHFSYVWAPLLTLVIAIAWTFATMTAFGFVLSILDVAVIPLIVGLGVDYVVHISRRYQEGLFGGMNTSESIGNSIRKVGAALFLAFVTTIVAFLSNVVSEVPPIRQFGFMCALGITYAYVLAITFYPSIRLVVDKKRGGEAAAPKPTPGIDGVMKRIADLVEERPRPIMGVLLVLVVGSLFAATMVPVEFNVEAFLPEDWESISTNRDIRENFDVGSYSAVYVLVEGEDLANPAFLDSMFNITEKMEDDSLVVKVVDKATGNETYFIDNIATMVSKAVEDNRSLAVAYELTDSGRPVFGSCTPQDIRGLFDHISENEDIYDSLKGLSYVEAFPKLMYYDSGSEAYTASVVRQQVTARNDADNLVITDEATEDIVGFKGGKASLTGGVVLIQKVIDQLSDSQVQSTIISTIFALAILTLIYRSITLGVVSISPVIVAMSLTLGSMWVLGISLNALTIMITSLTIGLGIDYSIHVVERFREEEKEHRPSKALHRTLENTGAALLISALTTIFGFGVLVLAGIPIFSDFGIVTAVMIVYSMLAAVIVTPIVMMWLARRKIRAGRGTEAVVETGEEVSEHGEDDGSGNVIGPEV